MRAGLQNGIPVSPGLALAGMLRVRFSLPLRVTLFSLLRALASRGFRLAGQRLAFSLVWWWSEIRGIFGGGGRPNGMVHLLFGAVSKESVGLSVGKEIFHIFATANSRDGECFDDNFNKSNL